MLDADLKEFEDYLSEFNSVPKFDSEVCPICGINYSDAYLGEKIPLIELAFENEKIAQTAIKQLESGGIKTKQSSTGKEKILIPEAKLKDAKSVLKT